MQGVVELTGGMTGGPSTRKTSDVWAVAPWIGVALTPVGFILAGLWLFGAGLSGSAPSLRDWAELGLLLLTAPTAAEMLAARAVHAGHRGGENSAVMAGLLLIALLALYTYSALNASGQNWITVLVVCIEALGLPAVAWTHRPRRKGAGR